MQYSPELHVRYARSLLTGEFQLGQTQLDDRLLEPNKS